MVPGRHDSTYKWTSRLSYMCFYSALPRVLFLYSRSKTALVHKKSPSKQDSVHKRPSFIGNNSIGVHQITPIRR
jgi:hypothetical protein